MARKVRIGFIGAGGIAIGHFQRLAEIKPAHVAALTEPDAAALERFRAHCPGAETLPVYADYRDMLAREELDAAVILSPHTVHCEQICASLKKGVHVLSEKPMVCSIRQAKEVMAAAQKTGKLLMLSYQRHFDPMFRYMRDTIASGKLGEIQFVQAIQSQEWLRLTRGTWRQIPEESGGGQLNDSGSHLIDIVMWVTGLKVKEVFARTENFDAKVDINTTLAMTFENGALGSMSVAGNAPGWWEDHTIIGAKGALYLRQGQELLHQDAQGKPLKVKLPKYRKNPDANFIDCILGKDVPQAPPECGLRTIEVTEAAWKSAASGKPVRVP